MIVRFSVENFLSFKGKASVSFEAGSIKEHQENTFKPFHNSPTNLLKSIGVFGQNAGGKSNFIKGVTFMREFVLNSSKESNSSQEIKVQPFLFSSTTELQPSTFEIIFFIDDIKYRYGFSVTTKAVESEWLFYTEKRKESMLFIRAKQNYSFDKAFKAGFKGKFELFAEVTRSNSLFLSVLAQFNNALCQKISAWFNDIFIATDTAHLDLIEATARLMSRSDYRLLVNEIIKKSDIGIEAIEEKRKDGTTSKTAFEEFIDLASWDTEEKQYAIRTRHIKYNQDDVAVDTVFLDLLQHESLGTQKFFGILGPILYALKQRKILWIDEIDARMHALLLESVIALFNSYRYNPNGGQLIFTSHNTHILKKGLRRDQMAFVAKDQYGISTLDILHEKDPKVRNDATFDKDYLLGKYGAIPRLGSQLNIFDTDS